MAKESEHWCDRKHVPSEQKFTIGDLAEKLYKDLESYLLHDIDKRLKEIVADEESLSCEYLKIRFYSILLSAERLELTVKDANSVHAFYHSDFRYRRMRWIEARGICFRIINQCNHMAGLVVKHANIQKYVDCADLANTIQHKIYNLIKSDDRRRKKYAKTYGDADNDYTITISEDEDTLIGA
jgi:Na+/phosphate symporter